MIEIQGISKSYKTGDFVQKALDDVSIAFRDSEFVAILGASGSGKTTLLNVLGGLDRADSGDIVINGVSTKDYKSADWDTYRNHRIGFIFQSYNLIPHQSVLSNVELALTLSGMPKSQRKAKARAALEEVGLAEHASKRPNQLSGGQAQRVAIARALVNDPEIVLADEPTGALDTETGLQVMELLSKIADDRLVIMVTHNPELAERYATRIIRLSDGKVIGDSDPIAATSATEAAAASAVAPERRASMSFATALSLSFNNLMSKKGRTIMTAIAGSIGIIGIASILALANGVNNYIAKTEQETLSSYPLTISKSSYDLSGMLSSVSSTKSSSDAAALDDPSLEDAIPEETLMADMFKQIRTNDLKSFKEYLDSGQSGIEQYSTAIQYQYDVTPYVYMTDTSDGPKRLNPSSLSSYTSSMSSIGSSLSSMMTSDSFNEMIDEPELLDEQYEVVAGKWPSNYDECVLVLDENGTISDYTLYALGVYDPDQLSEMVESLMGADEIEIAENSTVFTYQDALNLRFKVVNSCDTYRLNSETGTWTSMIDDDEFMTTKVAEAMEIKVVGVVKARDFVSAGMLMEGIAYPSSLTYHLIEQAAASEPVKQQQENPDVDIFSGKTFDELNADAAASFDLSSLFTVDEDALASAFSIDESLLGSMSIDASSLSDALDSSTIASMLAQMPSPDLSSLLGEGSALSDEQQAQISQLSAEISSGFLPYWYEQHPGESITSGTDFSSDVQSYLASEDVQAKMAEIAQIQGQATSELVTQAMQDYMTNTFEPYMNNMMYALMQQMTSAVTSAIEQQMSGLSSSIQNAFTFDADAFADAIEFNMSDEDLASIMSSMYSSGTSSYDDNMAKLGYASLDTPYSISIYPIDFASKDSIKDCIEAYNDDMRSAGEDSKVIGYSDFVGTLMSSVTDIVNMISYVLIAFVCISLVVSSIMIGIITYISVLERKKEIGILRAMGASKGNIANIFNAETIIEGLLAGVLAIAVVMLASIPVNAIVLGAFGVEDVMSLPWSSAFALIGISVLLTFIAGLIPSSAASRRDPVEALRSE